MVEFHPIDMYVQCIENSPLVLQIIGIALGVFLLLTLISLAIMLINVVIKIISTVIKSRGEHN